MRTLNKTLLDNVDIASSVNSDPILAEHLYTWTVQSVISGGTPTGTLTVQGSCDAGLNEEGAGVTNWFTLGSARTFTVAGTFADNFDGQGCKWVRVSYVTNTSVGALTVKMNCKGS
jgi:hypothetical protein